MHRLADFGWAFRPNERRLKALGNAHRGERCVLVGNGPSLRVEDLERLRGEITFGCNRLHVVFHETSFRPTYYSVIDITAAEEESQTLDQLNITKLLPYELRSFLRRHDNCVFVDTGGGNLKGFSENPLRHELYGGHSVLFFQLQLAFFMGFSTVYLIGCDHRWTLPTRSEQTRTDVLLVNEREQNHFHSNYRKPGQRWAIPKPELQAQSFAIAQHHYRKAGRAVINATRGGNLEIFDRDDFDRVFRS